MPLALGKAVHKAIERVINGDSHSEAVLKGLVEADFHPEVEKAEVEKLLNNAPVRKGMGETEVHFRLPLSDSPSAPQLQGYIDLIDGDESVTITDWKSNWVPYDVLVNHQLGLYAWAIQQLKNVDTVEGRLFFLRFKKESKHIFDRNDTEKARQWALNLANEINSKLFLLDIFPEKADELFPATPSGICSHCPFAVECFKKFSRYSV